MSPDDQFVLDAAGLGGRPAFALDAAGGGTAIVVDVSPHEMLDVWAAARGAVGRTGRWPLLCSRHAAHDGSLFSRFYFPEGSDPAAVLARAGAVEVDARLAELRAQSPDTAAEWIDAEVERERQVTLDRYGQAPAGHEIRAAVTGAEPVEIAIDRYLYRWERRHEPIGPADRGVQDWYGSEELASLVLLPAAQPWAVYAFVDALYDACWYGQDLLVAAARRWYESYGAEPVGAFGVMTWLAVARPPTDPDHAWQLAYEHYTLAENTLVTTAVALRHHAHLLSNLDRWVLFSRP